MLFFYSIGAVILGMLFVVFEERRQAKGLRDRVRQEVLNHKSKSIIEEYYEPPGWRR